MSGMTQAALEMRKALQFFVGTMDADTQLDMMLEIPSVFPAYAVGVVYKEKDVFSYGMNAVGDPPALSGLAGTYQCRTVDTRHRYQPVQGRRRDRGWLP